MPPLENAVVAARAVPFGLVLQRCQLAGEQPVQADHVLEAARIEAEQFAEQPASQALEFAGQLLDRSGVLPQDLSARFFAKHTFHLEVLTLKFRLVILARAAHLELPRDTAATSGFQASL
jgi:hypothetical protein